jgi:hypothetical protein
VGGGGISVEVTYLSLVDQLAGSGAKMTPNDSPIINKRLQTPRRLNLECMSAAIMIIKQMQIGAIHGLANFK